MPIGEFSKLCAVPITTLRFWDKKGLLAPSHINKQSGYRFYDTDLLEQVQTITALQRCGLSIAEIKRCITPVADMEIYATRLFELKRARQRLEEAIRNINFYLEDAAGHSAVVLKSIPEMQYLSSRRRFSDAYEMHKELARIVDYIIQRKIISQQPFQTIGIYRDIGFKTADFEYECLVRAKAVPRDCPYTLKTLPSVETAATIIYIGNYDVPHNYHSLLTAWIEQHGYIVCGPTRIWFVTDPYDGRTEEGRNVSELQIPVERKD